MIEEFPNDEEGYLRWVQSEPAGYVVNIDDPNSWPKYPMVHVASHKSMSSASRSNYTTGKYFKVCSVNLDELEQWSQRNYQKALTRCKSCM